MAVNLAEKWASRLGLVRAPLFREPSADLARHHVLLDGERGSFTLSDELDKGVEDVNRAVSWAWSADLPHYVGVEQDSVTLHRWDDPTATRRFTRQSIEGRLEQFYEFLRLDRVKSSVDVVEHSVDVFRRIRSLVHEQGMPHETSVHVFLLLLARMLDDKEIYRSADLEKLVSTYALDSSFFDVYRSLTQDSILERLAGQFRSPIGSSHWLEIVPELLVRHASGVIFQEAHYELVSGAPTNLFEIPGEAKVNTRSRGGTHFTPPGLARSIVEQALGEVDKEDLVVLDPACGAGAFLLETLRHLQRCGYQSIVTLIGYDVSSDAVAMARFALTQARQDWMEGKIRIRLESRDSLEDGFTWPQSDAILMNPPFISWVGMNQTQREQVKATLGNNYEGRPDYSMAFVEKALDSINFGGVVGTLMPASLLNLDSSLAWRRHLLDQAAPRYVAALGDYALFRHAMVEAAYMIFAKQDRAPDDRVLSLWTSGQRGNTGEALRNLRKLGPKDLQHNGLTALQLQHNEDWNVSVVDASHLEMTPNWRPRSNRVQGLLEKIGETTQSMVADIFHVRQGIRTGYRRAFIISDSEYSGLPSKERPYFRPVAENRSIRSGRIIARSYVFYPSTIGIEPIGNEADLQRLLPMYYERFLKPNRKELEARKSLRERSWWDLSEPRAWLIKPEPKLLSAYFGDAGSFAWDEAGEYALVQGFAWLARPSSDQPKLDLEEELASEELNGESETDVQSTTLFLAYLALLNSLFFELLIAEFCPRVAGGQYDLSPRFINRVPVPDLRALMFDPSLEIQMKSLAREGEEIHRRGLGSVRSSNLNRLVAEMYRTPFEFWPNTGE